jgi:hypothetical protein
MIENILDLVLSGSYIVTVTQDIPQCFESLLTEVSGGSYKFSSIYSNPSMVLDANPDLYGDFWYCVSGAPMEDLIASGIIVLDPPPSGEDPIIS